jgi:hypothetical protein
MANRKSIFDKNNNIWDDEERAYRKKTRFDCDIYLMSPKIIFKTVIVPMCDETGYHKEVCTWPRPPASVFFPHGSQWPPHDDPFIEFLASYLNDREVAKKIFHITFGEGAFQGRNRTGIW